MTGRHSGSRRRNIAEHESVHNQSKDLGVHDCEHFRACVITGWKRDECVSVIDSVWMCSYSALDLIDRQIPILLCLGGVRQQVLLSPRSVFFSLTATCSTPIHACSSPFVLICRSPRPLALARSSRADQVLERRLQPSLDLPITHDKHVLLIPARQHNLLVRPCIELVQTVEHVR